MNGKIENEIRAEFSRQAKPMASAPAFHAAPVMDWLVEAVGSASSDSVLDLACGPGIMAEAISPRTREVVGIDVTQEMIRLARERFNSANLENGHFSVAAAERLPFNRGYFDQAMTRLSFHHFANVPAVLDEIRRVLRPGGRLILADVVSSENPEESALHNSLEQLRDPTHIRMFPRTELLSLIGTAGFEILHAEEWEQARAFPEWAAIIANPKRVEPLENIMRTLARAGQSAGIALREEARELLFTHTWMLLVAKSG